MLLKYSFPISFPLSPLSSTGREDPTEREVRAEKAAKKERKALVKKGGLGKEYAPKKNVRKNKGRKR